MEAIRRRGGGRVEARPIVFGHYDPVLRQLRRTYGWRSDEVMEHLKSWPVKDVPGIGPVQAASLTSRTGPHLGLMSMFERHGFEPIMRNGDAGVVMRLEV